MNDNSLPEDERKRKLLQIIRKVGIFSDLDEEQAGDILSVCSKITVAQNDFLCRKGEYPDRMFILIKGEMVVKINDSSVISTIIPVNSIGEMGVFTGEPRTANVIATEESSLISLNKSDIDSMIENNPVVGVKIMRRVILTLSGRLIDDNKRIREFQNYILSQESGNYSKQ
jgi:CRP-like cAMP-binding protein